MQFWQMSVVRIVLCGLLLLAAGCAGHQGQTGTIEEPVSIERPAVPVGEEENMADKIGEVGIVLLGVAVLVGGIVAALFATKAL